MNQIIQPDLFGEYDADQERARRYKQPGTCPACGTTEPNLWLLRNNHGIEPDSADDAPRISTYPIGEHPIYGAMCTAQHLVSNHIRYGVINRHPSLIRDMTRGRELGLDVEAIAREATEEMG